MAKIEDILSNRINRIEESGIRKVFALAAKNKREYINLSIGQPHFSVPQKLKQAAKDAIDDNANAYISTCGLQELREAVSEKLIKQNNINSSVEDIIITSGVSGAIFLLFSSIFNKHDEVILPDPYFVLYKRILNFLGVKIIFLDTYPDFRLHCEKIKKLISSKTKAIIINTPNNPTGIVYSKEELKSLADAARKHDLLIISDEIYEKFDYENKFFSVGRFYDKTVTLNGFSKSLSITGWRVGYAHGPGKIIKAMNKLQQYTFVCAPSMAQAALVKQFDADISLHVKKYQEKRNYLYENLKDKYTLQKPEGAFYAYIKYPENYPDFGEEMLKNKLLTVPSEVFSEKSGYFRLSFAVSDEVLEKGLAILKKIS